MREQNIEYRDGDVLLEGFLCYDESLPGPRPAVLINHTSGGRDDFVERKARRLAWQGYVCFAMDNFGKGKRGATAGERSALTAPFMKDRALLLKRPSASDYPRLAAALAQWESSGRPMSTVLRSSGVGAAWHPRPRVGAPT